MTTNSIINWVPFLIMLAFLKNSRTRQTVQAFRMFSLFHRSLRSVSNKVDDMCQLAHECLKLLEVCPNWTYTFSDLFCFSAKTCRMWITFFQYLALRGQPTSDMFLESKSLDWLGLRNPIQAKPRIFCIGKSQAKPENFWYGQNPSQATRIQKYADSWAPCWPILGHFFIFEYAFSILFFIPNTNFK